MLVGGDLGFLVRVVFTGLAVICALVVWFVVNRKWRRSVARREEIKRLLVLASEETARAELEAAGVHGYGGYGYEPTVEKKVEAEPEVADFQVEVRPPVEVDVPTPESATKVPPMRIQYQCEVCFSPTTTRCKQCKAVHYCSGKCQIIHWRQGHKDECRPYAVSEQIDDVGDSSHRYILKPVENKSYNGGIEIEGRHDAMKVEVPSGMHGFPDFCVSKLHNRKDDVEVDHLTYEKKPASNRVISASISNGHSGTIASETDTVSMDQAKPSFLPESSALVDPADNAPARQKGNTANNIPVHVDGRGSSTSSSSSVDGSNESSFSEPSTPSSEFWEGTIKLRSARDAVCDTSRSCSDESSDIDVFSETFSCCSSEMSRPVPRSLDIPGSETKKVLSDSHPPIPDIHTPSISLASSVGVNREGVIAQRSSLSSEKSDHLDFGNFNPRKSLKSRETKEPAIVGKGSSVSSLSHEKSKSQVEGKSGVPQEKKSVELNCLSFETSDEHLSSGYRKHAVQSAKPVEINTHLSSTCSSDFLAHSQNVKISSKASVWKVVDQIKSSKFGLLNSFGAASDSVGRYSNKGLFPYELFVKLYNWNKVELHPCGLMNCGNSCYANVVLQCLAFTPPLTAYFLQGLHSKACKRRDWCFICEFEGLVLKAQEGNSPISPSRIISKLQNIGSHLGSGREEDAHEFLRCVIDTMQGIYLKDADVSSPGSFEEETTLMGLTFGGHLRSKIECMRCGGKSERHEKMLDLTVEIGGDISTLEEALRQFTHTETLDGENKYNCSRCKSYEKARKKLRVLEAPNVLTIALKRFQSGKFGKLNKTIKFPEILDLAPYMSGTSDKSPVYRLFGVVVHLDIMNAAFSGHYVCYVKNVQSKWFKIDDSSVKAVELDRVLTKGAYMLLYARCSPRAPRSLRSSLNLHEMRKTKPVDCKPRHSYRSTWDVPIRDPTNPNYPNFQPFRTISEEDSFSDNSFFSEEDRSISTDSSNRDSTSTDDYFDQIFADMGVCWNSNSSWRNSSDSDTSSSSSSPSPMYSRHSDLDHYAGRCYSEGGGNAAGDSGRSRSSPFLCPDSTKHCRKLDCSCSCRESGSSKLGRVINPFDNLKSSVSCRNR